MGLDDIIADSDIYNKTLKLFIDELGYGYKYYLEHIKDGRIDLEKLENDKITYNLYSMMFHSLYSIKKTFCAGMINPTIEEEDWLNRIKKQVREDIIGALWEIGAFKDVGWNTRMLDDEESSSWLEEIGAETLKWVLEQ
tara:strand:- start:516 stop:932 length:417 start_codon:yes stop_codon:yes gene_type:complete